MSNPATMAPSGGGEDGPQPLVRVIAPATLEAGYTFLAVVNGRTINVTVPEGGVKQGQSFLAPLQDSDAGHIYSGEATPLTTAQATPISDVDIDNNIPRGYWRDGFCDCCRYGPFHVHLWMALCFPPVLMAQVLTRQQLTWLGNSGDSHATFRTVLLLYLVYLGVRTFLRAAVNTEWEDLDSHHSVDLVPDWESSIYYWVNVGFFLYTLIVMTKLRSVVRNRYSIGSVTGCDTVEDCCVSYWFPCCTIAQLARHTADYDQRPALCCTPTGLPLPPSQEPIIVVTV